MADVEAFNARQQSNKTNERTQPEPPHQPEGEVPLYPRSEPAQQESHVCAGPLSSAQTQERISEKIFEIAQTLWSLIPGTGFVRGTDQEAKKRYFVVVIDCREKLIDEDNLEAKFLIDCLRYSKKLPEDDPETCKSFVTQIHVTNPEDVGVFTAVIEL